MRDGIWKRICSRENARILVLNLIITLFLNLLLEFMERKSIGEVLSFIEERTFIFLYNGFIIFLCLSIVFAVKKKLFAYCVIGGIWALIAIANGIILNDRKTPFTAVDLTIAKSTLPILNSYLEMWQIVAVVVLIVAGTAGLVCLYLYLPERSDAAGLKGGIVITAVIAACFCAVTYLGVGRGMLIKKFDNLIAGYQDYGVAYGFCVTAIDTGIDRPINYSRDTVRKVKKKVEKKQKKTGGSGGGFVRKETEYYFYPAGILF